MSASADERAPARQRAPEHRLHLAAVLRAERLRRQPGRAGAQEIEGGEDEVEDQRADRQPAEQRRIAEPADDRRVGQAEQRRRQEGAASSAGRSARHRRWVTAKGAAGPVGAGIVTAVAAGRDCRPQIDPICAACAVAACAALRGTQVETLPRLGPGEAGLAVAHGASDRPPSRLRRGFRRRITDFRWRILAGSPRSSSRTGSSRPAATTSRRRRRPDWLRLAHDPRYVDQVLSPGGAAADREGDRLPGRREGGAARALRHRRHGAGGAAGAGARHRLQHGRRQPPCRRARRRRLLACSTTSAVAAIGAAGRRRCRPRPGGRLRRAPGRRHGARSSPTSRASSPCRMHGEQQLPGAQGAVRSRRRRWPTAPATRPIWKRSCRRSAGAARRARAGHRLLQCRGRPACATTGSAGWR